MSTDPPLGKFDKERLDRYVFPYLNEADRCRSRLRFGSDFNLVHLDNDNVLVLSTDPLAVSPQLGWKRSARLALQVILTDVAVSGVAPCRLLVNWNLPPELSDVTFEKIWREFTSEAHSLDVKIIGGHTGRYQGQSFPIVGAGTVLGLGRKDDILSGSCSAGDKIYLLNKLGVEAAGIFAFYFPEKMAAQFSQGFLDSLKRKFDRLSPTSNLISLSSLPNVRSVHDIAEGGFLGGLQELLAEGDVGAGVDTRKIEIDPEVSRFCRKLNLDPLRITSIGSAILVASPGLRKDLLPDGRLKGAIQEVGEVKEREGVKIITEGGSQILQRPVRDQFWDRLSDFSDSINC